MPHFREEREGPRLEVARKETADDVEHRLNGMLRRLLADTYSLRDEREGSPGMKRRRQSIARLQRDYQSLLGKWRLACVSEARAKLVSNVSTDLWRIYNSIPQSPTPADVERDGRLDPAWNAFREVVLNVLHTYNGK